MQSIRNQVIILLSQPYFEKNLLDLANVGWELHRQLNKAEDPSLYEGYLNWFSEKYTDLLIEVKDCFPIDDETQAEVSSAIEDYPLFSRVDQRINELKLYLESAA